jgi:hypothetical protein
LDAPTLLPQDFMLVVMSQGASEMMGQVETIAQAIGRRLTPVAVRI